MNGAESLVATLVASGVEVCFANPGTSEMHFVAALDRAPGMRAVLALFEGVVTGAADGYGRMADKPACTLLHLGPGLANGAANLHNARRASTPIVNIVGDHATYHAQYDAPLGSDIIGLARTVSGWTHSSTSAKTVAADGARAVQAALAAPGQIATLILPADTAWNEADSPASRLPILEPSAAASNTVDEVARSLLAGKRAAILLRGRALRSNALEAAGRIAAKSGVRLLCDTFAPRIERGAGRVAVERIPYFAEQMVEFLKDLELLVIVGSKPPVSFFAYPGKPSWCLPEGCRVLYLAHAHEDGPAALLAVVEAMCATREAIKTTEYVRPGLPNGAFNQYSVGQIVSRFLPENCIISDEGATCGAGTTLHTARAHPHDYLTLTGGSIGQGLPLATGAAVACLDRKVIALEGDGSGMYTLQALWTQAREKLDVTTIVFANKSYAILNIELARVGAGNPGPKALSMLDLHNPELSWVSLAHGMGVEGSRATTNEEFAAQFEDAIKHKGPRLIEVVI
jgi:acetolactate synthase-1/2/3 large subunit